MAKVGKPSSYTKAIGLAICERIASGQSMTSICDLEGMPAYQTICHWRRTIPEFLELVAHAREDQAETMAERMLDVSESEPVTDEFGKVDAGMVAHNRLRVDVLKWRAAHLKPKVYGDKQTVEHQGGLTIVDLVAEASKRPAAE